MTDIAQNDNEKKAGEAIPSPQVSSETTAPHHHHDDDDDDNATSPRPCCGG